jgi:rhomboid protease GluP
VLGVEEPWRILSATFVHFGVMHIAFNMLATIHLGQMLERHIGSARFIVTVIVTAIAGFGASQAWDLGTGAPQIPTGGASGGISGLIGALVGYLFARRDPAYKQVLFQFVAYAVLMGLLMNVNNAAHAGGFLAGLPFGYFFCKESRPWKLAPLFRVAAAACIVASIASVALCANSDIWRVQKAFEMQRSGR